MNLLFQGMHDEERIAERWASTNQNECIGFVLPPDLQQILTMETSMFKTHGVKGLHHGNSIHKVKELKLKTGCFKTPSNS